MQKLLLATLLFLSLSISSLVQAEIKDKAVLDKFINKMVAEHQFERAELVTLFKSVEIKNKIIETMQRPAEGMPWYKYVSNRFLTLFQNIFMNQKLSEYHTGYRAFSKEVLESVNYNINSDDFIFDNQMLAQIFYKGFEIAEITCPTKYFEEASSINLKRSIKYGLGVLGVSLSYFFNKIGISKNKIFK